MASELEKTQEENTKIYIQMSKKNIDNSIDYFDYRKAFKLLILVLERLNEHDKVEFIDYYSKKLNELYFIGGDSHLEAKTLSTT